MWKMQRINIQNYFDTNSQYISGIQLTFYEAGNPLCIFGRSAPVSVEPGFC